MKVEIVDFFPTEAGAEAGVFYFNRHKKMAILYRGGNQEVYHAILPNIGQPGSRFKDSDGDGIPDIREASMYDLQDIGWTPASGSTFNKPAYTSVGGVTVNATQVAISSLDNPLNVLFNGSSNTIRINKALQDGAIQRHDNTWDTFVQNQTIDIHNGDYLIYDTFIDSDGDGTSDSKDAFPNDPNEDTDIDGDGVGANTDVDDLDANRSSGNDDDGDGIENEFDNDPNDGPLGDIDNDGIANNQDVFPADPTNTKYDQQLVWNEMAGPLTTTGGPYGLSASTDSGETISFSIVSGPGTVNGNILNPSSDGVIVVQASAPGNTQYNPASVNKSFNILDASTDTDSDGTPDLTDTDDDNDGVPDTSDNYPTNPNRASGNDNDGDGIDDEFDTDDDNDGVLDGNDGFPLDPNKASNTDTDGDGVDDLLDNDNTDGPLGDSDNDGVNNSNDNYPNDPNRASGNDSDGDGTDDEFDTDDDNDSVLDINDAFPLDPNEDTDSDGDDIGDNTDTDDDGDGILDVADADHPDNAGKPDADGDGIIDEHDDDHDNDGIPDTQDSDHPSNINAADSDGDGIIDAHDTSDDRSPTYIWLGSYERITSSQTQWEATYIPQLTIDSDQTVDFNAQYYTDSTAAALRTTDNWSHNQSHGNASNYDVDEDLTFNIANGQTIASVNNGVLSFSGGGTVDLEVSFPGNTSYQAAATRTIKYTVQYVGVQTSFLGISPVLIQGTPVSDFNQQYNHVGGRLPDWPALSNLSSTGGQMGWQGFSPPTGGWPVYRGVQNRDVYIMKWGATTWLIGYRGTEQWANTPPVGYTHLYPVDRTLAYVSVNGGTNTEELQESTARGGWFHRASGGGTITNDIPITATLI